MTSLSGGQADVEMLEDLITGAVNEAGRKADEAIKSSVQGMLGGLKIPGSAANTRSKTREEASRGSKLREAKIVTLCRADGRLIEELKKLPGVGTKSAQRYAFHILRSSDDDANSLAEAVARTQGEPAPLLHLQQRYRHRSLRLLRQPYAQPAADLRGGRSHQHRNS
ncbi:MAG: YbaB/EbfC family nucleoid-associated protein [Terracidiphilus sp.]